MSDTLRPGPREGRRGSAWLAVIAVLFTAGCAGEGVPQLAGATIAELPFHSVRLGAAAQPYLNQIELPEGREREAVTFALVQALQGFDYSIVAPPLAGDTTVLYDTPWQTDILPVPATQVAFYNASVVDPSLMLPLDQLYGLRYEGRVTVQGAVVRLVVRSVLHSRGARSAFREYAGSYGGKFFADRLVDAFSASLRREFRS